MSILNKLGLANRALQHVGQKKLLALTGDSTGNPKAATEIATCYDMLRRAELRRNVWRFSIRRTTLRARDTDTMVVTPDAWVVDALYPGGSLVTYGGLMYQAIRETVGDTPDESFSDWQPYFGPQTASEYVQGDTSEAWFAGELVYAPDDTVYLALTTGSDYVLIPLDWDDETTYSIGDRVWFEDAVYTSYQDSNLNESPGDIPAPWDNEVAYVITNQVTYLGNVYQASGSSTGDVPTDGAPWTLVGASTWDFDPTWPGDDWIQVQVTLAAPFTPYPIGTGPFSDPNTAHIFTLPAGFLREAPQSPKSGSASIFGAPTGIFVRDWLFENDFILSGDPGPIHLRFAADCDNVAKFDPLFAEGLAARIGFTVCEPLTQSNTKIGTIAKVYSTYMGEARTVNAIEKGSEEPAQDDWIATRL